MVDILPASIAKIKIKTTTAAEVEKLLGKPALIEKNKHYYEQNGFKYSLEIIYDNNLVREFSYTFASPKPVFDRTKIAIDMDALSSSSGRYFKYSDEAGDLVIDPVRKSLYSVRIK